MRTGDLVQLAGSLFSTWSRQDEIAIVVFKDHETDDLLVCFANDDSAQDFTGYEDHFEVINAA